MVLRFCQENIRRFGGDPDRITLMGQDAGAVAAHFHILSPLSKGLFSKAILQSGTAAMAGAFVEDPIAQSKRFGKRVGCLTKNTTALVMCLKRKRAKVLILPSADTMSPVYEPWDVFAATLERVRREDTFLFEHPLNILEHGNFNAVPVIMGVTSAEGCLKTARKYNKFPFHQLKDYMHLPIISLQNFHRSRSIPRCSTKNGFQLERMGSTFPQFRS